MIASGAWDIFVETGEPVCYLIYKSSEREPGLFYDENLKRRMRDEKIRRKDS